MMEMNKLYCNVCYVYITTIANFVLRHYCALAYYVAGAVGWEVLSSESYFSPPPVLRQSTRSS